MRVQLAPELPSSAWLDLCWHGLALLPLPAGDAASLYDPRYIAWTNQYLQPQARTLPTDAATLAHWLARAPHGHWLHALPQLHSSVEEFAEQARRPFGEVRWADPQRQRLAQALERALPAELIEVFRAGLWGELRAGYLGVRDQHVEQRLAAQRTQLSADLGILAQHFAAVQRVQWRASHPLRRHGRLFRGEPQPTIAIGIPDPELQLPRFAPVLQGWHELVLLHVLRTLPALGSVDPRAGTPGHAAHQQAERWALTLGARLLAVPELLVSQGDWLRWVLRRVPAAQGADAGAWLASGALLPGSSASEIDALAEEVARSLRSAT